MIYAIRAGVMAIAAAACVSQTQRFGKALFRTIPLLAFLLWATSSMLWTDVFPSTLNAMGQIWPLVIVGVLLTVRLSPNELAQAFIYSGVLMAGSSILWSILMPHYGVHQFADVSQSVHAGAWRGVYLHKNHLGQVSAMYAAALLFTGRSVVPSRALKLGLFGALALLIVKSGSASPFVIMAVAPFVVWLTVFLGSALRAIAGVYLGLCSFILVAMWQPILELLGRDPTLTGRTRIWDFAIESILQRPLTGYGYMSPTYGDFTFKISNAVGVMDPHNGYFDLMLGLGLIGFALFIWSVIACWQGARAIYRSATPQRHGALVLSAIVAAWVIGALSESIFRPLTPSATLGFIALCIMAYADPDGESHGRVRQTRQAA